WPIDEGRGVAAPGEVVVDRRIGAEVGDEITVANRPLRVVGTTSGVHIVGGRGVAWVGVDELQTLLFAGQPLVSGFVVDGRPTAAPDGTHFVDRAAGRADLLRLVRPII